MSIMMVKKKNKDLITEEQAFVKKVIPKRKSREYKHFGDYLCTHSYRMKPMSEAGIEDLISKQYQWATQKNAYRVNDFLDEIGVSPKTYHEWRKKHENLQESHDFMIRRIASNRENGALTKNLDASMVKHRQFQFDADWRDADAYHAKLRENESGVMGPITVIQQKMPETDLVPFRKKKEE